MSNLFRLGQFILNSGNKAEFKIEADALTNDDWECLAYLVSKMVVNFGFVEGVPRGGTKLAECLKRYITYGPLLIVDDVLTTGGSMDRHRNGRHALGAVVFDRSAVRPGWISSLFVMSQVNA